MFELLRIRLGSLWKVSDSWWEGESESEANYAIASALLPLPDQART